MTDLAKTQIIQKVSLSLFVIVIVVVLWLLSFFAKQQDFSVIVPTAVSILNTHNMKTDGTWTAIDHHTGLFFSRCFKTHINEQPAIVIVLPITGYFGSLQAVFVRDAHNAVSFIDLINTDTTRSPRYYGISNTIIEQATARITHLFEGYQQ